MKKFINMQVAILSVSVIFTGMIFGQIPHLINYSAALIKPSTGQPVQNGTYTLVFSIYDVPTGGSALWTETHQVLIEKGLYAVMLGSMTPLTATLLSGPEKYLGVKIDTDTEMLPRKRIVSVAYAIISASADSLGGKAATEYALKLELATADGTLPNYGSNQVSWYNLHQVPDGFADGVDDVGGGDGNSLDQAYDQGGPGAGRTIVADTGPLEIRGNDGLKVHGTTRIGTINEMSEIDNSTRVLVHSVDDSLLMYKSVEALASQGIDWQGLWVATTSYDINDAVEFNGSSYIAVQASTGSQPDTNPADWNLLAQRGIQGLPGPVAGNNGDIIYNNEGVAAGSSIYFDDIDNRIGIGTTTPSEKLTVNGTIESKSGGIKFPDGTFQTTAATSSGSVNPFQAVGTSNVQVPETEADADDMTLTTTATGSNLLVIFSAPFRNTSGSQTDQVITLKIVIDGSTKRTYKFAAASEVNLAACSFQWLETGLAAGNHTVKIRWQSSGHNTFQNGTSDSNRVLSVMNF